MRRTLMAAMIAATLSACGDSRDAGTIDLTDIDTTEEDPARILLTETQTKRLREPDGVSWITNKLFATANEGDMDGGSRSFSIFDTDGQVIFDSGNALEHQAVRVGHYPDARSGNKGTEQMGISNAICKVPECQ
ncbi:MAG: hypothetical protein R3E83_02615 [Burkholderiaceae bacterium]